MRKATFPARAKPIGPAPAVEPSDAPYVLIEPLRRSAPLIFASPHSGRRYPPEMMAAVQVSLESLRRGEDAFVDELFAPAAKHGALVLAAVLARSFIDLNREPYELDPNMFDGALPTHAVTASSRVLAGLGSIAKIAGDGRTIYHRKLTLDDAERRIRDVYLPYHAILTALIDETRAAFGCAVLIDCHSMPSCARGPHAPDIVLGDRFGASCHASVVALAEATLRKMGYQVARNAPFAGGHITQFYGRPAKNVHALQIELNRGLYLDERTLERGPGFARVRADMARLAEVLAAAELNRSLA